MNIEIANRLLELRKKNGLSQDELASKLGISRQSVSKWERAEASPDTDNLICLAKIYNISLDELLSNDESVEEIASVVKEINEEKSEEKKDKISINLTDDEGQTLKIENGKIQCINPDGSIEHFDKKKAFALSIIDSIICLLTLIGYFIWSFVFNAWDVSWVLWIFMPAAMSIFEAILKKRFTKFLYPCLVTGLFCLLGMQFDLWHPLWFLFITIPFFYVIFGSIDKIIHKEYDKNEED